MAGDGKRSLFIHEDGGFTSLGTIIAMLLAVALTFATAQSYWVSSESASVQDAADAGALAAANVVGEYMVVARVCDGVTLTMSLLGLTMYGVSVVAACIPGVDAVAGPIAQAAGRVLQARNKFADSAIKTLDQLQKALPYVCAVNSAVVVSANGAERSVDTSYLGLALPVPLEAQAVELPHDEVSEDTGKNIETNNDVVEEEVAQAQEAKEEMQAAKQAGYMADCGGDPCMRERASVLAGLLGAENPSYASAETWEFQAGINRAMRYYQVRLRNESPNGSSIDEIANSVARGRFYDLALELVSQGSVTTGPQGETQVSVPFLPQNTADMRNTRLYTEQIYPVSADGALHCSTACSACDGATSYASVKDLEEGAVKECETCHYSVANLGRAPSASTNIANGFEHHYRDFARAAQSYTEASMRYIEATTEAKNVTNESLDVFKQALEEFAGRRYDPKPPGRYGCMCVVVDLQAHDAPSWLGAFGGAVHIEPRMAVSAAMLAPEKSEFDANIISSIMARVADEQNAPGATRFADAVINLWGNLLTGYQKGVEGFLDGVDNLLSCIPGSLGDELGQWAKTKLKEALELAGLQPVKMESLKPVTVNTIHVVEKADARLGNALGNGRNAYNALQSNYVTMTISLSDWLPDYEVSIGLPWAADFGDENTLMSRLMGFLRGEVYATDDGTVVRKWE